MKDVRSLLCRSFGFCALTLFSFGCAGTPSVMLVLGYSQPPKPADPDLQTLTAAEIIELVEASVKRAPEGPDLGSGETQPEVRAGEAWSIVVTRVHIDDHFDLFGSGEVAILLRVKSGDGSDTDNEWVLARVEHGIQAPQLLNFDNLIVWSGATTQEIQLDVKLIDLDGYDKKQIDGFLSLTGKIAGLIPTYGALAQSLVAAGRQLNQSRGDAEIMMEYTKGFHPQKRLKYACYAMLPQAAAQQHGRQIWFDNEPNVTQIKVDDSRLFYNWVAIQIMKGSWHTFEHSRAKSLAEVVEQADQWRSLEVADPTEAYDAIGKSLSKVISAAESMRILQRTEFGESESILRGLSSVKRRAFATAPPALEKDDFQRFFSVLRSYLPREGVAPIDDPENAEDVDAWIEKIKTLGKEYEYDETLSRWKKTGV